MPYAVTHVLIAMIIAELIRDYLVRDKKKFPLHYVLIAGIAGLLPDADILLVIAAGLAPSTVVQGATEFHPSFTHSLLWVPIALFLAFLFLWLEKKHGKRIKWLEKGFTKHHLRVSGIFFMIALGLAIHFILDFILTGYIRTGFFSEPVGLNIIPPTKFGNMLAAGIDAILLLGWLVHEELRHKISRFL